VCSRHCVLLTSSSTTEFVHSPPVLFVLTRHCWQWHLFEDCASSLSRTGPRNGDLTKKCSELQVQDKTSMGSWFITSLSVGAPSQQRDGRTMKDNLLSIKKSKIFCERGCSGKHRNGKNLTLNHDSSFVAGHCSFIPPFLLGIILLPIPLPTHSFLSFHLCLLIHEEE